MAKKRKDKKSSKFSKVKELYAKFKYEFRTNIIFFRIFISILTLLLFVLAFTYGPYHKHVVQKERALTISDINQEVEFSQTGNEVKLKEQKRYKDMTVVPIEFASAEEQKLDAKNYVVNIKGTANSKVPKNLSASLVFFGSDGKAAIVLKGSMEKAPLNIILEDKSKLKSDASGTGEIIMDGKPQKVDFNAVSFNINPKGENVKLDKKISQDMTMQNLFLTSFGDAQFKKLNHSIKQSKENTKELNSDKEEYQRRITQINKAIGTKKDDFELDETVDETENSDDNSTIDDSKLDYNKSEMSTTDLKSVRNNLVNKIEDLDYELETEKESLKGLKQEKEQLDELSSKMKDLTSLSNNYRILK